MCERGEKRGEWAVPLLPSLGLLVNRVSTERVVRSNIELSSVRSVVSGNNNNQGWSGATSSDPFIDCGTGQREQTISLRLRVCGVSSYS